jgi:hypothetical protein
MGMATIAVVPSTTTPGTISDPHPASDAMTAISKM